MANEEHLKILKEGVEAWNRWREGHEEMPDLRGADLFSANLRHADLHGADLFRANLRGAYLHTSNLRGANLRGVNFSDADLREADLCSVDISDANVVSADLRGADLSDAHLNAADLSHASLAGANLRGANLCNANLRGADICGTDLQNAIASGTIFASCDLSEVRGLDLVEHYGPCTIGLDTIYKSKGKIPACFLRGCGVPESFIEYMPSLIGAMQDIQFYSCFISHSSKDGEFVRRLYARMQEARLPTWYAQEDMKGGVKSYSQIDEAIRVLDKVLLVLSEHSMQSDWVKLEIRKARKRERATGKTILFPISIVPFDRVREWECIDSDAGEDLACVVRSIHIPDFSNWKDHDSFESAFAGLLADLKAG